MPGSFLWVNEGGAEVIETSIEISELIKTADANMYEAKRKYYVEHGIERRVTGRNF